jgi:DNA-binding NarL/FixJ family response regulator
MTIRVILLDDHLLIQKGIANVLAPHSDIELVGVCGRGSELLPLIERTQPDVLILDLSIAGEKFDAQSTLRNLAQSHPNLRTIILTGQATPDQTQRLRKAGAVGFLFKNDDISINLAEAIRIVFGGKLYFSPAALNNLLMEDLAAYFNPGEIQIIRLLAQGFTNASIAREMNLSESRVKNIMNRLFTRLNIPEDDGINPRTMVVATAIRLGLIDLEDLPLNTDIGWASR